MKTPLKLSLERTFPFDATGQEKVRMAVADVSALISSESLQTELLATLSPQRQEKALACSHPRSRALSIGVALLLDELLSPLGLREADMSYAEGEHGKPCFATGTSVDGLLFNLSHSGHLVAAALYAPTPQDAAATSLAIGIDIQHITRYRPELVRRVFSAADRQRLAEASDETARQRIFAQLWCRAESYAKATGQGLQWPFPTPPAEARFHEFCIDEAYCSMCVMTIEEKSPSPQEGSQDWQRTATKEFPFSEGVALKSENNTDS